MGSNPIFSFYLKMKVSNNHNKSSNKIDKHNSQLFIKYLVINMSNPVILDKNKVRTFRVWVLICIVLLSILFYSILSVFFEKYNQILIFFLIFMIIGFIFYLSGYAWCMRIILFTPMPDPICRYFVSLLQQELYHNATYKDCLAITFLFQKVFMLYAYIPQDGKDAKDTLEKLFSSSENFIQSKPLMLDIELYHYKKFLLILFQIVKKRDN